jgi:hypothetical protein
MTALHEPGTAPLRELAAELAAVELPTDGLSDATAISDALDQFRDDPAASWRLLQRLFRLVAVARRLVGTPPRRKSGPEVRL